MSKQPKIYKAVGVTSSKPIAGRSAKLSVTSRENVADKWKDSPRSCYRKLEPWLRLANLISMTAAMPNKGNDVDRFYSLALDAFPEPRYPTGYKRALAKEFPNVKETRAVFFCETYFTNKKAKELYSLAFAARETFEVLIRARQDLEAGEEYPTFATGPYRRQFQVLPGGQLSERPALSNGNVLREALLEVKMTRLMRCEICESFTYAVREGQKTCSKRCNTVRRVRAWRASQSKYEYNRKLKSAGVKKAEEHRK